MKHIGGRWLDEHTLTLTVDLEPSETRVYTSDIPVEGGSRVEVRIDLSKMRSRLAEVVRRSSGRGRVASGAITYRRVKRPKQEE